MRSFGTCWLMRLRRRMRGRRTLRVICCVVMPLAASRWRCWFRSWSRCLRLRKLSPRDLVSRSARASTVYGVSESVPVRNSQFMNPYGVGRSGATVRDYIATCECCEIEFMVQAPGSQEHHLKRCDQCVGHKLEGTADQQLAAFREHHNRYPAVVAKAREMTREAMAAKESAERELASGRRQVAAALESRDHHRGIHEAVMAQHVRTDDGRCLCGQRFPCPTWDAAKAARERFGNPEEPF